MNFLMGMFVFLISTELGTVLVEEGNLTLIEVWVGHNGANRLVDL
jgi:hypothetical protein